MDRFYPRSFRAALLFSLLLWTLSGRTPAVAQRQRAAGNPFKPPEATLHYARDRDYHVRHLRLVFDIDAAAHSARGVVTQYLTPFRDPLQAVVLDAGPNLKIESCRLDGVERKFLHQQDKLIVLPASPLPRGKEVVVEVRYTMPPGKVGGGANGLGGFHWIDADPKNPERKPGFWTQGETETNHNWVPCYDYPNDKCTSETITTVPENWEVIGNGVQGRTTHDAARHTRTFRWTMSQPHSTYLLSLAGGELDIHKASWAGVPLYYVVPKGEANLIDASFGNTPDMLQLFSTVLGVKYPWPKYAQDSMLDFGGGMENVSATTLGAFSLTDRRSGYYRMSSLTSHELAHQWFGDYVTCKDWGDIWLNESFATFFEMLYTEHLRGKDYYDLERDGNIRAYLDEAQRYKRPLSTKLYANPDVMFDSHTYPKGGVILHMLRRELGDADFFRGLGYYLRANAYTPVDSHDLEKAIAVATGRNVEPFFDQWVFKPGHPVLDASWTYDEAGKTLDVHVKQTQDTSDGTPIYHLPLTIGLLRAGSSGSSGSAGTVERQRVTLDQADQQFRLPAAAKPDVVLIDPDHDLLTEIKTPDRTEAEAALMLRQAPCVLDRRAALAVVTKGGLDDAKIALLTDALRTESGDEAGGPNLSPNLTARPPLESGQEEVAGEILSALGDAKKESLRPLFRAEAHSKSDTRRAAALEALGKLPRANEDMTLLRTEAGSDTEQYSAVEAALTALGQWDTLGNLDVFKHQVEAHSLRDRLAVKAVAVLGESKSDAIVPILVEAMAPGKSIPARSRAARAVGTLSPGNPAVQSALLGLLQSGDAPLQDAAIDTLKARKDKSAVAALREVAQTSKNMIVQQDAKDAADAIEGKQ